MDAQADDFVDRHMGNRDDGRPMHTLVSNRLLPLTAMHSQRSSQPQRAL